MRREYNSLYSVYDIDDEFIMCGTVRYICKKLNITKSNVCKAVKNGNVVRRKYRIYYDEINPQEDSK